MNEEPAVPGVEKAVDRVTEGQASSWPFLVLGLLFGLLVGGGLPLWDDDYTSWLRPAMGKSFPAIMAEIVSPVSTQAHTWGFNERPWQLLYYKLCYSVSGYNSWFYWLLKSLALGTMLWAFHRWASQMVAPTRWGRSVAGGVTALLLFAPCTTAAFLWHADFEPVSAAWFLLCARVVWQMVEADERSPRAWALIIVATYLGYKTKATLKMIPAIAAAYSLLRGRPRMLIPLSVMALLAVPWSSHVLSTPPFLRKEGNDLPGWMWKFPSLHRLEAFFWNTDIGTLGDWLNSPTLSLAGVLGPLLLLPLAFVAWPPRIEENERRRQAALFVALWVVVATAAVTVLPDLPYTFRVRYGLILMVPVGLLLTWTMGRMEGMHRRLLVTAAVLLLLQCGLNLHRALAYRASLGPVIAVVDAAYTRVSDLDPDRQLYLVGVLSYDWHPDAPPVVARRIRVDRWDQATGSGSLVLSWEAPPPSLRSLGAIPSVGGTLFDRLYPWPSPNDLHLSQVP